MPSGSATASFHRLPAHLSAAAALSWALFSSWPTVTADGMLFNQQLCVAKETVWVERTQLQLTPAAPVRTDETITYSGDSCRQSKLE